MSNHQGWGGGPGQPQPGPWQQQPGQPQQPGSWQQQAGQPQQPGPWQQQVGQPQQPGPWQQQAGQPQQPGSWQQQPAYWQQQQHPHQGHQVPQGLAQPPHPGPHGWQPAPPARRSPYLGPWITLAVFVLIGLVGSREEKPAPRARRASDTQEEKSYDERLARDLANVLDGTCEDPTPDPSCSKLQCTRCRVSKGTVHSVLAKDTPNARKLLLEWSPLPESDDLTDDGDKLPCSNTALSAGRDLYRIASGPLEGIILVVDYDASRSISQVQLATTQYFLPSVGSGWSSRERECVFGR